MLQKCLRVGKADADVFEVFLKGHLSKVFPGHQAAFSPTWQALCLLLLHFDT